MTRISFARLTLIALATVCASGAGAQRDLVAEGRRALYAGDLKTAAALARQVSETHPEKAAGRVLLGEVLMAAGRYEEAFSTLRDALRAEPDNVDALYFLGKAAMVLGQLELQKVREMAPDSPRAHQLLGEAYALRDEPEKARKEFLAALEVRPRMVEVLDRLGDLERKQNRCLDALSYYRRAAAIRKDDFQSAYGQGACYLLMSEYGKAAEFLRRAVKLDGEDAAARYALARALVGAGDAEAARTELRQAVRLEPGMRQAYYLLGQVDRRLGRGEEAREAFRKAQELYRLEAGAERPGEPPR